MLLFQNHSVPFSKVSQQILVLLLLCISIYTIAQTRDNDALIRQQGAINIINFSQQVDWSSVSNQDRFVIGVLGTDPIISNINVIGKRRSVHGKIVEVRRINTISGIKDINVIYAGKSYKNDTQRILQQIHGKEILLISNEHRYNASMINMLLIDGAYKYEINTQLLSKANLTFAASLGEYAITTQDKWEELYKSSEEKLSTVQKEIDTQKEIIEKQQEALNTQKEAIVKKEEVIERKDVSIATLELDKQLKNQELEDKLQLEKELETNIRKQVFLIQEQEASIETSKKKIVEQEAFLEAQKKDILKKEAILEEKISIIDTQRKRTIILLSLIGLLLLAAIWISKSYFNKRKINKVLASQHKAIQKQSVLLKSKNKELEQFAYIASHDLQEPLNTVSSFIDLIRLEYEDKFDDDGKVSLGFIKEASLRMKRLIDALLQYSRLGREDNKSAVDCTVVLKELQADLKTVIEENNAEIVVSSNLGVVTANEIELRLLFQNLISNAIKFTKPDKSPKIKIDCQKVTSCTKTDKECWQFSVSDNGIGISEEHQERIFGIFQRLHTRGEYQGTGIGLAHCKKIVEAHGGTIWLTSEEGKGSAFYFTIPL